MTNKLTEADLGAAVATHLEGEGWNYFAEVQVEQGDRRADLVATSGRRVMVVETKLSLSIDVLSQALNWLPRAHYVLIAVPERKAISSDSSRMTFVIEHLKRTGIGLWFVEMRKANRIVREIVRPQLHRYAESGAARIRENLVPEMRDDAAGSKVPGLASTPFKRTCLELRRYVQAHPGQRFDDAMSAIPHHYGTTRSARSSLDVILKISGLVIRDSRLYVEGDAPEARPALTEVPPAEDFALTPQPNVHKGSAGAAENPQAKRHRTNLLVLRCQACRKPILVADQDKIRVNDTLGDGHIRSAHQIRERDLPYTFEYHRAVDMPALTMCTCGGK